MDSYFRFLTFSIIISATGFLAISLVIIFFADRLIRPISESYQKQKRFITDAGHELKTPLSVINANVDILEMEHGSNEGLSEIRQQSERLASLTSELVLLARLEETERVRQFVHFPLSDIVEETVESFKKIAVQQAIRIHTDIKPILAMQGDQKEIAKLVSILMDNAMKYTPKNGNVSVLLKKQGHSITLSVCNDTAQTIEPRFLQHVFDRFYRMDSSRNSETGGYGIGLSIAQAIVHSNGGKIQAWSKTSHSFGITATFFQ